MLRYGGKRLAPRTHSIQMFQISISIKFMFRFLFQNISWYIIKLLDVRRDKMVEE